MRANPVAGNVLGRRLGLGFFGADINARVVFVRDRADQLGMVFQFDDVVFVQGLDFLGDGVVLFALATENDVGMIESPERFVRRHRDDVELVDLPELGRFGHGGAGHAADLVIKLEEVLQRDRGQRLVFFLDPHPFFGLDRLVQAVAPVAPRHQAAREVVDDDDLAVHRDVVHVALVKVVGLQRVVDQVRPFHVAGGVKALDARQPLGLAHALIREMDRPLFLLHLEMDVGLELPSDLVRPGITADVVVGGSGDNERRAGFVDQDVVDFVDNRVMQRPLGLLQVFGIVVVAAGGRVPHMLSARNSRNRTQCSCRK